MRLMEALDVGLQLADAENSGPASCYTSGSVTAPASKTIGAGSASVRTWPLTDSRTGTLTGRRDRLGCSGSRLGAYDGAAQS